MRLVIDTNLMIRALLAPGPAYQFFASAPRAHVIVYHAAQIAELRSVAVRPRLAIPAGALSAFIERIERLGDLVESPLDDIHVCRDPKDDYLLALALAGRADSILTEDKDLLVLNPWRGVRLIRLFEFLTNHPLPE